LNDNFILEWNEDRNEILYLTNANSLYKRNAIIDHMKDDCEDVFLCMKDVDYEYMKDESETFLRDSCMNDELFDEVEDGFSECCNDMIDISCIRVYVCYKNDNEERETMMRISSSGIEDKDTRATEFKDEF